MHLEINELLELLQTRDECCQIEAKETKHSLGTSIRETISAFSNEPGMGGGYLILGARRNETVVSEKRYTFHGVANPDKIQCELANLCRGEFNIKISPEIRVLRHNEVNLIVAFIPESISRDKPIFIKKFGVERGAFRRIGSSDHRCTVHDLDLLYQLRSGVPFENEVLPDVYWDDIDPEAVSIYRRERLQVEPKAPELSLDDQGLLLALRCLVKRKETVVPNVAGLLLFGTKSVLRKMLPSDARVDYVITEGADWIGNPSVRHFSMEYREPLVTFLPKLHAQIMSDLPKLFGLKTGHLQRTDTPVIPRDVIREALANALMHKDYRAGQPTLIIRYSNRLEFKNAGYSLKPFEELGQPGSKQRNPIVSSVFHELKYAEGKGTGIGSMKEWMRLAGLTTPPIIETSRDNNEFDLVLLPHHLLDKEDLEWLSLFGHMKLSDPERRALVLVREMGAITNQDYRQINGTDTLMASKSLAHLRDLGLLTMKGTGSTTYYVLSNRTLASTDKLLTLRSSFQVDPLSKGLTPYVNPLDKGLDTITDVFPSLPKALKEEIRTLPKRCSSEKVKKIILELCALAPLQPSELGRILNRDAQYLRINFLSKMIKSRELVYQYPDQISHPLQAYQTFTTKLDGT